MTSKQQGFDEYQANRRRLDEASDTGIFDSPRKRLSNGHYLTEKLRHDRETCSSSSNTISGESPGTSSAQVSPPVGGDGPPKPQLGNDDPRLNSMGPMKQDAALAGSSKDPPMSSLHQQSNLGSFFVSEADVAKICKYIDDKDLDSVRRLIEGVLNQSQSVPWRNDRTHPSSNDRFANLSDDLPNTRQYLALHPDTWAGVDNNLTSPTGREKHGFAASCSPPNSRISGSVYRNRMAASYCGHSGSVDNRARSAYFVTTIPQNEAWNDPAGLYFSIRQHGHDFLRLRSPDRALFFSSRLPEMAYIPFYASWNQQVMRCVQDKFGMSLKLLKWIQEVLENAKVPMKRDLEMIHFDDPVVRRQLNLVLPELLGKTLKVNPCGKPFLLLEYQMNDELVPVDSLPKLSDMEVVKHLDTPPPSPELADVLGMASEEVVQSDVVSSQVSAHPTNETSSIEADSRSSQELDAPEVVTGKSSESALSIAKNVIENDDCTATHYQQSRVRVSKMPVNLNECSVNVTPSDAGAMVSTSMETSEVEKSTKVIKHTAMNNAKVHQPDLSQSIANGIHHRSGLGIRAISAPVSSDSAQSLAPVGVPTFGADSDSPELISSIPQEKVIVGLAKEHLQLQDLAIDSALVGIDTQNSYSEKDGMRTVVEDDDLPINDTNVEENCLDAHSETTQARSSNVKLTRTTSISVASVNNVFDDTGFAIIGRKSPQALKRMANVRAMIKRKCRIARKRISKARSIPRRFVSADKKSSSAAALQPLIAPESKDDHQNATGRDNINSITVPPIKSIDSAVEIDPCSRSKKEKIGNCRVSSAHSDTSKKVKMASCQVKSKEGPGTFPKPQPNPVNLQRPMLSTKPERTVLDLGPQDHFETVENEVPSPQIPQNDFKSAKDSRPKTSKEGSIASISSNNSVGRVWNGPAQPVVEAFKTAESTNIDADTCSETLVPGPSDSEPSSFVKSSAFVEDHNYSKSLPMPDISQIKASRAPGDYPKNLDRNGNPVAIPCHLLESPNSIAKKTLECLQATESVSAGETPTEDDFVVLEEYVSEFDPVSARSPSSSPEIVCLKIDKPPGKADPSKAKSHDDRIVDTSAKIIQRQPINQRHLGEVSGSTKPQVNSTTTLASEKANGQKIVLRSGKKNQDGSNPPQPSRPKELRSKTLSSGVSIDPKPTATASRPSPVLNLSPRAGLADSANVIPAKTRINVPFDPIVLAGGGKPISVTITSSSIDCEKPKKSKPISYQGSQNKGTGSGTGVSAKRGEAKNVKHSHIESAKVLSQIHMNPKVPEKPHNEPVPVLPATSPDLRASDGHQNTTDDRFTDSHDRIESISPKLSCDQRAVDILQTFMQKAGYMVEDRDDCVFIRQKHSGLFVSEGPGDGFVDAFFQCFADGSGRMECLRPVFAAMAAEYLGCRGKSIHEDDVIDCLVAMQHDAPMVIWLNDVFPRTVLCHGKSTAEALRQIDQRHPFFVPYLAMISNDTGIPVDRITEFLEKDAFGLISPKLRSGFGNPSFGQKTLHSDPPQVTSENMAEQNSYLLAAARVKSWAMVMTNWAKEFKFFNKTMITLHACVSVYAARFEPGILAKMMANIEKHGDFSNFFQYWFNALDSWLTSIRTSEEHLEDFEIYFQYFGSEFVAGRCRSAGLPYDFDINSAASGSENAATLLLKMEHDAFAFALNLYVHNEWAYREMRRFLMNKPPGAHMPAFSKLNSRFQEVFAKTEQQFLEWLLITGTGRSVFAAWVTKEVACGKDCLLAGCPVVGRNFWTGGRLTNAAVTFCHDGMDTIKNLIRVLRSGSTITWTSGVGGEFLKGLFFACFQGEKCKDVRKLAAKILEQIQCQEKQNNMHNNALFVFLRSLPGHIKPLDVLLNLERGRSTVLLALNALLQMNGKSLNLYSFVIRDITNSLQDVVRKLEKKVVINSGIAVDKSVEKRPAPCLEDSLGQKPSVYRTRTISPDLNITLSNSAPRVSVSDGGFRGSYEYVRSESFHLQAEGQNVVDRDRSLVAAGSPLVVPDAPSGFKRVLADEEPPVGSAPPKRSRLSDGPGFGIRRTISGSNHQRSDYTVDRRDSVFAPGTTDNRGNGGIFSGNSYRLNRETGENFNSDRSRCPHMPVNSLPSITVNQRVGPGKIQSPGGKSGRADRVSSGRSFPQDFSPPPTKGPVYGRLGEAREQFSEYKPPNINLSARGSDNFSHRRSRFEEVDRERMDLANADLPPLFHAQERPGAHVSLAQYRKPQMPKDVSTEPHSASSHHAKPAFGPRNGRSVFERLGPRTME